MSVERKYMAHFIDASFGGASPTWVRLGKDLEEYNIEMSPNINSITNILGEKRVKNTGYDASAQVSPYFYEYDEALSTHLESIINNRSTGDECRTSVVDVILKPPVTAGGNPTVVSAYKRPVFVAVDSIGGNTEGVQIPFTLHDEGAPVAVTWDPATNTISNG